MAILAVPFALSMGRRGSLTGDRDRYRRRDRLLGRGRTV